jgi:Trk K+ transport system NAD-binding subunit
LIIAASKIGMDIGVISPGINSSVVILAVITCFLSPILFNSIYPPKHSLENKVIIVGGSSTGVLLARRLEMHEKKSIILEIDATRYKQMAAKGLHTLNKDGLDANSYKELNLSPTDYIVVTTGNEEKNTQICELIKDEFNHPNIITKQAISQSSEISTKLKAMKIETFDVKRILATTIENLILRPTTYHTLVETFENFNVEEVTIENREVHSKQVKDIPLHQEGFLILIRRDHEMIVPHGNTYLKEGDLLTVFGTDTAINSIKEKFV